MVTRLTRLKDETLQKPLVNVKNSDCPICQSWAQAYASPDMCDCVQLEHGPVTGEYARTTTNGLELSVIDMSFQTDMTLACGPDRRNFRLGITCCLDGGMMWKTKEGEEIALSKGGLLVTTCPAYGVCSMVEGQHVRCVDLAVTLDTLLSRQQVERVCLLPLVKQVGMSPRIRTVVSEILDGRPSEAVQNIYCLGKAHELLALVLENLYLMEKTIRDTKLPEEWSQCLLRAKELIDSDLANAPSLAQLSRYVCLNEYKLKTGFKKLFGLPVHAYIINQRLESAYGVLQRGDITVTEAAHQVGFTELGRFAGAFRKKFGMKPSEILKNQTVS